MIHIRHFASVLAIRDNGDSRTLVGPLLPWGVSARVVDQGRLVTETFQHGALAGTDPTRIPLTATHPRDNQTLPIGVTVELEERADAAWGAWRVSKTALGDEVLALAADGVPLGLSVGFQEVPGGNCWSPDRSRVTRTKAALDHVAVVRVPAYEGAGVVGVRGAALPRPTPALLTLADCAVGKGFKRGVLFGPLDLRSQPRRCIACRRLVVWGGDRCQDCRDKLRQRRRRKPR